MKIAPANGFNQNIKNIHRGQETAPSHVGTKNAPVAFKGVSDVVVKVFEAIGRGGFASSFIVGDVIGTGVPRTYEASKRGMDRTGKRNWKAAAEHFLREILTGPSMFLVPGGVLMAARKLTGSANDVPMESIQKFSDILSNTPVSTDSEVLKKNFYEKTFTNIAENSFGTVKDIDVKKYAELLLAADNVPKRNTWQIMLKKDHPKGIAIDQIMEQILEGVEEKGLKGLIYEKKAGVGYNVDFTSAQIAADSKPIPMETLLKQMKDYADDAAKYVGKNVGNGENFSKVVADFKNSRTFSRFVTNPTVLVITALFLSIIPKIYSFNKQAPDFEGLYEEIDQTRKGPVNANNQ